MKNLSNCTNTEFLQQAVRIRAPFKAWLERTGIPAIRARVPEGWVDMTEEEVNALPAEVREARRAAALEQAARNTAEIIDAALTLDFDNTVALLCLATFTDPERFDDVPILDYLNAVQEMMRSPRVIGFFRLYL